MSGGDVGAKAGKLAIMVGGESKDLDEMKPYMNCYGANIAYMGGAGFGQHTKMANQTIIADRKSVV